jgi:hypothetical protein
MTRRYCVSDLCSGQSVRRDQDQVYLVRWSTTATVHTRCPHCHEPLKAGKPPDGGMRELGPIEERKAA